MDVINFPGMIAKHGLLTAAQLDKYKDLLVIGKKQNVKRDGSQYEEMSMTVVEFLKMVAEDNDFCKINLAKSYTLDSAVNYNHPSGSGATNYDNIGPGLHITRGTSGWLFNPLFESSSNANSPANTLWSFDTSDLSQVENLVYDTLENVVLGNLGSFNALPGNNLVMYHALTNKYYFFEFLTWQSGAGGGAFSYNRYEIKDICSGCITFSDGTKLCTAPSVTPPVITIPATDYYVDAAVGNDGTALPNRFDKPYLTIAAALAAAPSGTPALIYVRRGTYASAALTVKNSVNFYFEPGCVMSSGGFRDLGSAITCRIMGYLQMTSTATFNFTGASNIVIEIESMSTTVASAINIVPGAGISNIFIKARFINSTVPAGFSRFINIDRQANLTLDVSDYIIAQRFLELRFLHDGSTNILVNCPRIILPSTINAGAFSNPVVLISASTAGIPTARANVTVNGDIIYTGPDKASEYLVVVKDGNFTMNGDLIGSHFSGILFVGNQGIIPPPATTQRLKGNVTSNKMAIVQNHSTANVIVQQSLVKSAGLGIFPYAVVMGTNDAFPSDPGGRIYFKDCRITNTDPAASGVIITNNNAGGFGEVYAYNSEIYNPNLATGVALEALAAQNAGLSNIKSNVINNALITNLFGAAPAFIVDAALIIPQV